MDSNLFVFTETISSNGDINFAENVVIDGALFVCLSSATGISQHAPQLQTAEDWLEKHSAFRGRQMKPLLVFQGRLQFHIFTSCQKSN
ncbi:hypothetical protein OUZ56_013305 [Daphnia magna]|uniref:Uncharacterized protein n=1 Tax=Daphnia magna TaxID=35525 RepID=A0ABQ9Z5H9_9CRUS|nr:hypothetical protein OUZ56_013305 [Daphnia magna]